VPAPVGHRAARPQGPDDLHRLGQHLLAHAGKGPPSADDVLVQVLPSAEPEGEPPLRQQLHGRRLLRHHGGVISTFLLLEHACCHGEVLVAEPLIHRLLPFVGQAREGDEPVIVGRLEGQAHVLERQRQRKLGRELALGDPLQLGRLPGGHQWAAAQGLDRRLRSDR
jgi:hypothetical protein